MEKEKGLSTQQPPLSLHRLPFRSALNQDRVADDLAHLRTRHDGLKTRQTTLGALVTFYRSLPPARQPRLWQDVTRLTPGDGDAWLQRAQRQGLAPSTMHATRSVVRRFCTFLQEQTRLAHHPIHPRRHEVLVPQMRPRPMAEDDRIRFFQVIDSLQQRTIFLLMRRCGLRLGEVTTLTWAAIDWTQGTIRVHTSTGRVERVVDFAPDLEKTLRPWRRSQWPPLPLVCPRAHRPGPPVSIRAIQHAMSRYRKVAGISRRDAPQTLRPTFATQRLNAGASLAVLKELMGHRSITLTRRYAQVDATTKRTPYAKAMAPIEPRPARSGEQPMDDTICQAIHRFQAYLQRRP
jgi:site-specific recombinase XerD